MALWIEVSQFLAYEARVLDEERYDDWLALLTEDVHYWMPGIENRRRADPIGEYAPGRMAYFDDTLEDLCRRVLRFQQPSAWMEDPPTRHLHVVSNVEVSLEATGAGHPLGGQTIIAHSVVVNYRSRGERDQDTLYARRRDRLRRDGEGRLRIAERVVQLRHNVLVAKNINTFL
ncbi:MAG: ethylbenzene dioxygenase subunit beta [Acidimicrobiia bacterium]|jgi:ethylbenzene dioxygenase beta subunit|nr:ethylbenzene dioxygenase subunit beta [Acidimicrobiia bacterium]